MTLRAKAADSEHIPCIITALTEKRFFEWHEDDTAVTIRNKSGSYGGGSEVLVVCYGISSYESNAMLSDNPHSGVYEAETSRTLDNNGGNPSCNQGGVCVVEVRHRAVAEQPKQRRNR